MSSEKLRRRVRLGGEIAFVLAAVGVLLLTGLVNAQQAPSANAVNGTTWSPNGVGKQLPTPIKHVFLIIMENEGTDQIYGVEPYETSLANNYSWGGDANSNANGVGYYAVCHPSAPNYLALTSGQPLQCGSDSYHSYSVNNLGNLLQTAGDSWADYEESATVPCQETSAGEYAVKHNPFPYYSDLGGDAAGSACSTHSIPIANLTNDYPYRATPPAFTYIAPNLLDDGHDTSATYADNWLKGFIPKLMAQSWFSSSLILITYDESYGANPDSGYNGLVGGPVYTVAVSPYTRGVGAIEGNSSHYNLLSTIEWVLGLPGTGTGNDSTPNFPVMTGLFQPRIFGPNVNLAYTDLAYANLSGYNLRGDSLQYANLAGANLTGADLRGAYLPYADLATADLARASLTGAGLQYADLAGADLQGASLDGASLQYANLAGVNLRGAELAGAGLQYANLQGALLTGLGPSYWQETNFNGANLYGADLAGATCGTPNYIIAFGANVGAVGVPFACTPPL